VALPLAHPPSQIIRELAVLIGQANDPPSGPWPAYYSEEPDGQGVRDNVITFFDVEGWADGRSMLDGEIYEHAGIHVRVRAQRNSQGAPKILTLRNALSAILRYTVDLEANSYFVHCLAKFSTIKDLGDESPNSKRSVHVFDCVAAVIRLT